MTKEVWRDISGYEELYQVSNLGMVRSLDRIDTLGRHRKGKVLTGYLNHAGYYQVDLRRDGSHKVCRINRLVAQAFLDNPDNLSQVNHKDECKTNNKACNLEWCSPAYNCNFGTRNKRVAKANEKPIFVVTDSGHHYYFNSIKKAATLIGLDGGNISTCLNGERKTHRGFTFEWAGATCRA